MSHIRLLKAVGREKRKKKKRLKDSSLLSSLKERPLYLKMVNWKTARTLKQQTDKSNISTNEQLKINHEQVTE